MHGVWSVVHIMNTINLRCDLKVPNSQGWFFVIKSLAMDDRLKEIITDSDIFEIVEHKEAYVMTHHSKQHEDCRELFAFAKDHHVEIPVMYQVLTHCLKNAWCEHLI